MYYAELDQKIRDMKRINAMLKAETAQAIRESRRLLDRVDAALRSPLIKHAERPRKPESEE